MFLWLNLAYNFVLETCQFVYYAKRITFWDINFLEMRSINYSIFHILDDSLSHNEKIYEVSVAANSFKIFYDWAEL